MVDILNVSKIKRECNYLKLKILLSNNDECIVSYYGNNLKEAKSELKNINWKTQVMSNLARFLEDEKMSSSKDGVKSDYVYGRLMDKVENDKGLTSEDMVNIDECMQVSSIFKEFSYENWILN